MQQPQGTGEHTLQERIGLRIQAACAGAAAPLAWDCRSASGPGSSRQSTVSVGRYCSTGGARTQSYKMSA